MGKAKKRDDKKRKLRKNVPKLFSKVRISSDQ
jgi:hypothetical protein